MNSALPFTFLNTMTALVSNFFKRFVKEPPLSWSQLSHQKVRLMVAITGVAFANIMIFTMLGFKMSMFGGVTRLHEHLEGDLILVSNRAKFLGDGQSFSRRHLYQAAAIEGIQAASPFYYSLASWVNPWEQKITNVAVIAFDPARPVMDLPDVNQQLEQIKLPNVLLVDTQSHPDLGPITEKFINGEGVTTEVSGRRIRVGGLFTLGSTIFIEGHLATSDWNYSRLFGSESIENLSLAVLRVKPEVDIQWTQQQIRERLPDDVEVLTKQEYIASEKEFWDQAPGGILFNFGVIMGFIIGVVIVYQVLYADVNDHLSEYATLKAIGYSNRRLLLVVFQEGILLAILGFGPGIGCALGVYALLGHLTRIPVFLTLEIGLQVFVATVVMCLVSAAVAIRKLQSADPADVF